MGIILPLLAAVLVQAFTPPQPILTCFPETTGHVTRCYVGNSPWNDTPIVET